MFFKVTHMDMHGKRRRARVTAANPGDALDQVEREFGEARGAAVVRLAARPALRLVEAAEFADLVAAGCVAAGVGPGPMQRGRAV